jgi:hypothetical protein
VLAAATVVGLLVAGCSDSGDSSARGIPGGEPTSVSTPSDTPPSESVVPTDPATPTDSTDPIETPTDSPSDPPTDDAATSAPPPGDGGRDEQTPAPLPPDATNRPLTLSSIFKVPPGWRDDRFDVADRKQASGIGGELQACGDNAAQVLELRLANNFKLLKFDFGQSNASESSDQVLQVRVDTNGQYRDLRTVRQNQIASMAIAVPKVNALKIIVSLKEGEGCGTGAVQAVLMNLILT